jgi:hypothetical protein
MTPTSLIQKAAADGVKLTLSQSETIKGTGNAEAVNRWLPAIREHKAGLIAALRLLPLPGEIEQMIDRVMQLRDCPESDRQAFADDWRENPQEVERGLRHLAKHYGKENQTNP